jgi:hypothetical protein
MHVVEAGNRTGVVTAWKSVSGAQTMYNLEVTQDHTFIVGAGQWIVHNDCGLNSEGYFRENYKVLTNDSGELRPNPGSIKTPLGVTDIDAETENSVVSVGTHSKFYNPDGTLNNARVTSFYNAIDKYRSIAGTRQVYFAYDTRWGDEPILAKVLMKLAQRNVNVIYFNSAPWHFFNLIGNERSNNRGHMSFVIASICFPCLK